jgi:hypothetical protein
MNRGKKGMLTNVRHVRRTIPVRPIVRAVAATLVAFTFVAGLEPQSVQACRINSPLNPEDARQADVVFTGRLLKYERVSPGRPDSLSDYAMV